MKLTREQKMLLVVVRNDLPPGDIRDAVTAAIAACEVEEVDPVVEEARAWLKGRYPDIEPTDYWVQRYTAFAKHVIAKSFQSDKPFMPGAISLPAFDEGRAREIAEKVSVSEVRIPGPNRIDPVLYETALYAIKEYTCGSSGSEGGTTTFTLKAGDKIDLEFVGPSGGYVTTHSARRMAQAVGFDTESGGRGAGSSGTTPAETSGSPCGSSSQDQSSLPSSAPAAGVGCRWESAEEFVQRNDYSSMCDDAVKARDAAWVERLTNGDLSEKAFGSKKEGPFWTAGMAMGVSFAFAFIRDRIKETT